jgi:hypothetical protein
MAKYFSLCVLAILTVFVFAQSSMALCPVRDDDYDGVGIAYSYEYDEINGPDEILEAPFKSAQLVEQIFLTNFYKGQKYNKNLYNEGDKLFDTIKFGAVHPYPHSTISNGEYTLGCGGIWDVKTIGFSAYGNIKRGGKWENHDYSVAGLRLAEMVVPEPGTILLLGSSLIGLFVFGQKRLTR